MSRTIYPTNRWTVGEWQFFEIDGRQITDSYEGRKLFGFTANTEDAEAGNAGEWFNSLEHAMAAAIAEKHTGRRGGGGTGIGTAADWFMRMIGVDQIQEAGPEGRKALDVAWKNTGHCADSVRARAIERGLENQGYVIARQAIS